MIDRDVCVIGSGVAGFAAALGARAKNASVAVVSGPFGASSMAPGAWDVAPLRPPAWPKRLTVEDAIADLVRASPDHPYSVLGHGRPPVGPIEEAHHAVLGALAIYRPIDLRSHGLLVATDAGIARRTTTAQHAILDLDALGADRKALCAVAHLRGYRAFEGHFVAASLSEQAATSGDDRRFVSVEVEFFRRRSDAWLGPAEIAALLDSADACARFVAVLHRGAVLEGRHAILLPPILGREDDDVPKTLGAAVGCPLGEALGTPGGPQGLRLDRRITTALERAEVTRVDGPAARASRDAGTWLIETESDRVRARRIVLATGKLIGGGITPSTTAPRESLLDLPIAVSGQPLGVRSSQRGRDPIAFFGGELHRGGPGTRAGVRVDASMRALDIDGRVVPDVFACGALLADHDPSRDGTGMGVAATTGWIAGRSAADG